MTEQEPKIHIDSDWKASAQAEKERLAQEAEAAANRRGDRRPGELPEASFRELVRTLASHAVMGLGVVGDPKTGRVVVDLPNSRFAIDLLGVLEEKTRGNISDEEAGELTQTIADLRARYVQISQLVAQQGAGDATTAGPGGAGLGEQDIPTQ